MRIVKSINSSRYFILSFIALIAGSLFCNAQNINTYAGTGLGAFTADGVPATTSGLHNPTCAVTDAAGNLYIADWANARVRKVNTAGIISTIAGTGAAGYNGDGIPATSAQLKQPNGVAVDAAGNIYIAEMSGHRIRKINTSGIISTLAGNGVAGTLATLGDGGLATAALVNKPTNLVVDGSGNIYFADWGSNMVRMISNTGIMVRIAGNGSAGYSGDGVATAQTLSSPNSVSLDALGNLYISDENNHRLRKLVLSTGMIFTIAGTGTPGFGGDGGPATAAQFNQPDGIVANAGQLYIADYSNNRIRKIDLTSGIVTTEVGNGTAGFAGDGGPATSSTVKINGPAGVFLDPSGNLFIADFVNNRIRKIGTNNHVPVFDSGHTLNVSICEGGTFNVSPKVSVTDSDVSQTLSWSVYSSPPNGTLFFGGTPIGTGTFYTAASTGGSVSLTGLTYTNTAGTGLLDSFVIRVNDGISIDSMKIIVGLSPLPTPAPITPEPGIVCPGSTLALNDASSGGTWSSANTSVATIGSASGILTGVAAGNVRISYTLTNSCGSASAMAQVMVGNPIITTVVGNGTSSYGGEGVAATAQGINGPSDVVFDNAGNMYYSDYGNNRIRKVSTSGIVTTVAGNGTTTYTNGVPATSTGMNHNAGLAVDASGNIYFSDYNGNAVRMVSTSGIITTFAGTGLFGYTGDGGLATAATLNTPWGVAVDNSGNVYISDRYNSCIRKVNTSGIISTIAGTGVAGFSGDGGPASSAQIGNPIDIAVDRIGNIYFPTWVNDRIRKISVGGIISTIAGNGTSGYGGDNIAATSTQLNNPVGIGVDNVGNVYVGDYSNNRLRLINTSGIITTIAGTGIAGFSGDGGVATSAKLNTPFGMAISVAGDIYLCDGVNNRIRKISPVAPTVSSITGPGTVCVGGTITLSDVTIGGVWSSSNPIVATVGSSDGMVTGNTAGVATIFYTVPFACGNMQVSTNVTVTALPSPISPAGASVCIGSSVTFTDATSGGIWSLTNSRATNVGGVVTGVSIGVDTLNYSIGSCVVNTTVTVIAAPSPISPSTAVLCAGSSQLFTNPTGGGVWSMTNTNATNVAGSVTGVSVGLDTVLYSIGSCVAKAFVTVNTSPAPISPTGGTICIGNTLLLTDAVSGGTWSATNTRATVVGGLVTGLTAGVDTIKYSIGSCVASVTVTMVTAPAPISPTSASVCIGNTVTFTDATSGGVWSATNTNATVAGGVVTGVTAGTDTIKYTIGSCAVSATVTVNSMPSAITPSGPVTICAGSSVALSDVTSGGTWSSNATGIATVNLGGVVTGVTAGTATISYTTSAGCAVVKIVTVVTAPAPISPASASVCVGNTVTFTDATTGGVWSATNTNATVSGGIVTGMTAGVDTINYTIGTCAVSATVTVNAAPAAITPSTAVTLCPGATSLFADATSGGVWSSSASGIASVSTGGLLTGVTSGTAIISYTVGSCSATKSVTINIAPAPLSPTSANICVGNSTTFTESVTGGVWSTSSSGVALVTGGLVTGVSAGVATISYTIGTCYVTAQVTVSATTGAGVITGPTIVCVGSNITLTDGTAGGVWSSGSTAVATVSATGVVLGVSGGTAVISYTISNACGAVSATTTVTVVPAGVLPITGPSTVCAGTFTNLTDATTGGTWSSSNATATISSTGLLTGITPGTDTITYTVTNVCGTTSTTKIITVGPYLTAGTITGGSSVCVGASITLSDLAPGGLWSVTNTRAFVTSGVVTGVSAGIDTVQYTVTSSCGSAVASKVVTVNPLPVAGSITGPTNICIGTSTTYTNSATGGVWSITNTHATITSGGYVTPISVGIDTIIYTVTNSCGTATTTKIINIGSFLTAGTITGPGTVCIGSPVTLTNSVTGGVWSASNSNATVSGTGLVTGLINGVDTISYTVTSSCGSAVATKIVTVNTSPVAGSITGPSSLCIGSSTLYTDTVAGGVWSFSNTHATVATSGLVSPVSSGTDTLIYTVTNACGSATATKIINIGAFLTAGTITGPTSVCAGSTITLADAVTGGTWAVSNTNASITGGGVVTGLASGVDTVTYTVSGSCGSAVANYIITINPLPVAGSITGPSVMCTGTSSLFTDPLPGGVWSSSNATATVSLTGLVAAVSPGVDTIMYTVTNVCGTAVASKIVTINLTADAGTIAGPTAVCVSATITLTDAATGGTWSTVTGNASVSSSGVVTGVLNGVDTVLYTVTTSCGNAVASYPIGIGAVATAGTISGPSALCVGALVALSATVSGGSWSSLNANATVTSGGIVTGIIPGMDTITYTVSGPCGVGSAVYVIAVNSLPVAGTISGTSSVCVGDSVTLAASLGGGVWSSSSSFASVGSSTGVVTGSLPGTGLINYTISNACGSVTSSMTFTVNGLPDPGTISGPGTVCQFASITLTDAVPGGTWSAANSNAVVSSGGVVTGVTGGTDAISYSVTNGCGTSSAVYVVTINTAPVTGIISGSSSVCVGSGITLTAALPGGTWLSSNAHGLMAGPGILHGISTGIDTVYYSVTGTCGTGTSSKIISVNPVPVVAPISGPSSLCVGSIVTLTNTTTGGIWSSSNPGIASIGSATGIATGMSLGVTTITYTVANIYGCPTSVTAMDTVNMMSTVPAISGPSAVCAASTITLTDALAGGTWSSSSTSTAVVGASSGIVTGVNAGVVNISYMVVTSCGTSFVTKVVTVNPLPSVGAISGAASECPGSSTTLADATPGGVWSSSNPLIAIVGSSTGVVTGVATGSVTISYVVTNSFGCSQSATIINTVNTAPVVAPITGIAAECVGATSALADATVGGTWSSSNPSITTVSSTGIVSGVAAGIATISYTVSGTGCAGFATIANTVNAIPVAAPITGSTNLCVGSAGTLANVVAGGTWSSSNMSVATISSTGVVSALATGTSEIYYTISNACGSVIDSVMVTVQLTPNAGTISGASSVCQGASITLSNSVSGGVWSATNARATVTSAGIVAGVSGGLDTIKYTVTNACGTAVAMKQISVVSLPYPGVISGYTSVCVGNTIALSETVSGGAWSSGNAAVATVSGGSVTGVSAGAATISYAVSNSCGTRYATHAVSVVPTSICETGVDQTKVSAVSVHPNPAVNSLVVEASVVVNVRILSVDGKEVISQKNAKTIDVSNLVNGMYLIMIYDDHDQLLKTAKFAKID